MPDPAWESVFGVVTKKAGGCKCFGGWSAKTVMRLHDKTGFNDLSGPIMMRAASFSHCFKLPALAQLQ